MRAVAPEGGGLTDPEVRPYGDVKKGYTSFISGDVIMAKITPCMENGKTAVVPALPHEHCFGSTEFHVVRPEGDVQPRWIVNFLLQHETRRTAQRHMTGAVGQMRVPTSFLEDLQIPIAPAREQLRIADVLDELLSDLDAGLEALTRAQTKLALYRSSVLKAAVQGDLTAEWRRQHPYVEPASVLLQHILTERRQQWEHDQLRKFQYASKTPPANWKAKYKQPDAPDTTNLPELPEGWCWVSFDQISDIQGGLQKTPKRVPVENHYPYLRVANVLRGAVDLRELHHFELTNEELNRLRLRVGDLLIVEGNGSRSEIGRCALWAGEIADCVHQNHIIRLRPLDGLHSEYLNLYLNSPVGQTVIQLVASSTSGLYTLSVGKIQKLPVALAPTAEQEQIAEKVAELFSVVEHVQVDLGRKADSVGGLRQSILRQAFTGRLVPQDPSDEPASKLLKLIAEERKARAMKNVSPRKPATKRQKREK
jgi:type I restriction enzyme S subunit